MIKNQGSKLWLILVVAAAAIFAVPLVQPDAYLEIFPKHVQARVKDYQIDLTTWIALLSFLTFIPLVFASIKLRHIAACALGIVVCAHHFFHPFHSVEREPHIHAPQELGASRSLIINQASFHNLPVEQGINSLTGYGGLVPRYYREFMDTQIPQNWKKQTRVQVTPMPEATRVFLSIDRSFEKLDENYVPTQERVYPTPPMPRYYVTNRFHDLPLRKDSAHTPTVHASQEKLQKDFEKRNGFFTMDKHSAKVEVLEYQNESIRLRVQSDYPAILASSEPWNGMWKATVKGRDVEIKRWYHAFRAVEVPQGESEVHFYVSRSSWYGLISLSGALFLLLLFFRFRPRDDG